MLDRLQQCTFSTHPTMHLEESRHCPASICCCSGLLRHIIELIMTPTSQNVCPHLTKTLIATDAHVPRTWDWSGQVVASPAKGMKNPPRVSFLLFSMLWVESGLRKIKVQGPYFVQAALKQQLFVLYTYSDYYSQY